MVRKSGEWDTGRRSLLKGFGLTAVGLSAGPISVSAQTSSDTVVLGDFEAGLDGWQTNGGNRLSRVSLEERPAAVTSGEYALDVTVAGDPYPMIENKSRVRRADFVGHPYLVADVAPSQVSDTASKVTFQFRYHHNAKPEKGRKRGSNGKQAKPVKVAESEPVTVRPLLPSRIYWDMSGLPEETLSKPKRLEVVWYPTDHPPRGGPRGRGPGFDYRGSVVFDSIRLSDTIDDITSRAASQAFLDLEFEHGIYLETVITDRTETVESGEFVFDDGTAIPYSFEVLSADKAIYTLDGEEFKQGSGW